MVAPGPARITFVLQSDGTVELKVDGVRGSGCAPLTAPFEQALGTTLKRERTDAYYQNDAAEAQDATPLIHHQGQEDEP